MNTHTQLIWPELTDYQACWQAMKEFTEVRNEFSQDQFWLVEHPPVFTLGLAGKEEHILLREQPIPIIRTDRGGQVTYHGPGQIVIYLLVDLKRQQLSIRDFVTRIENGVIAFLASYSITAYGDRDAPGVYVGGKKIASLGLKVRKGCTYHGLSFNFNLDKTPFSYINPCGYAGLQVINFAELISQKQLPSYRQASQELATAVAASLYQAAETV